jgi:hypothetical protein
MTDTRKLEKLKSRLNLVLIALFCSTTLTPCVIFYVQGAGEIKWLLIFVVVSYLVSLPKGFFDRFQISQDLEAYERLKVHVFKKLSTNGDFINHRMRKEYSNHRNVTNLESVKEKLNETYSIERAHTVLFVFCLLTSIYASLSHELATTIIVFVGNIIFNYYPNLLQQYNRIRYTRVVKNYL